MHVDFLNLSDSNRRYADSLKEAAARVIDSGRFLNSIEVRSLEKEIADFIGARRAVAVSNGLDAIRLIFRAYIEEGRLNPGDEVIYPANTYIATILPVTELGLQAVPAPVDPFTYNLDFQRIDEVITPRTKAVLLVHLYGTPCWDEAACKRLRENGILIIEDNAQALGAIAAEEGFNGSKYCGALGDAAAVSFYPTKNLGALGDAGMVLTNDEQLAADVRVLAQYGSDKRYHNIYRGYNNRMDELQAAFLRVKLPYLDEENDLRRAAADTYLSQINHPEVSLPAKLHDGRQVWHQFVIRTPNRDKLKEWLEIHGIMSDIHYPVPPHAQPCYAGTISGKYLDEAEKLANTILSLPIANISEMDAHEIASVINKFPISGSRDE